MRKYILVGILIIGLALRLWQIGSVPPSPDWDEAALGYNAYSILHTGKDEYGQFFPIVLRSFDDYKPALYTYLAIPSIALLGLNVIAVRLPSVIIGVLAILGAYILVVELFNNRKLGLIASMLLAISPWHIQFSRIAFESSVGMAFNLFSMIFFLKGLKKPWYMFLSILFICSSMYVYQSEKVFAPLLFVTLTVVYWKKILTLPKSFLFGSVILGLILILPLGVYTMTNKNALARAQGVSFLADQTSFLKNDATRLAIDHQHRDYLGIFFDNRRILIAKTVIANYISHFDLNWLFITGDISRHHAPGMGLLYLWELPFIYIGIYQLLFGDFDKKAKIVLFIWLLLVPIPASITSGVPHAVRTLNFLPLFEIAASIGLWSTFMFLSSRKEKVYAVFGKNILIVCLIGFAIFNFSYYLDQYFIQQNYYNAIDWQYGYSKAIPFVNSIQHKYKKIVVDNQPYMDQSYIFFLFYLHYPPELYQQASLNSSGGFREDHSFGKFEFRPIDWSKEIKDPTILYIGRASDFPTGSDKLDEINFPDSTPAMDIVKG